MQSSLVPALGTVHGLLKHMNVVQPLHGQVADKLNLDTLRAFDKPPAGGTPSRLRGASRSGFSDLGTGHEPGPGIAAEPHGFAAIRLVQPQKPLLAVEKKHVEALASVNNVPAEVPI